MKNSDSLIYSKHYSDPDSDLIAKYMKENCENVDSVIKATRENRSRLRPERTEIFEDTVIKNDFGIKRVPDLNRLSRSKEFIERAKSFSERYSVSIDIYEMPSMVSVWLLFSTDVLDGEKKHDFIRLLDLADELTGIPYPESMKDWCDYAVILNYMTHHCYVNGKELYSFN